MEAIVIVAFGVIDWVLSDISKARNDKIELSYVVLSALFMAISSIPLPDTYEAPLLSTFASHMVATLIKKSRTLTVWAVFETSFFRVVLVELCQGRLTLMLHSLEDDLGAENACRSVACRTIGGC